MDLHIANGSRRVAPCARRRGLGQDGPPSPFSGAESRTKRQLLLRLGNYVVVRPGLMRWAAPTVLLYLYIKHTEKPEKLNKSRFAPQGSVKGYFLYLV